MTDIDRDLFYLAYNGKLHISMAVMLSKRKNAKFTGTLCNGNKWHAIRPTIKELVHFPICEKCQYALDIMEGKLNAPPAPPRT